MTVITKNTMFNTQTGFSLVELMVAMVLSVILLFGVTEIYINSKQTYNVQEGLSRLQENARFGMERLTSEITPSGFMGCLASAGNVTNTLTDQTGSFNYAQMTSGTDNTGVLNTDVLTVIRSTPAASIDVVAPMATQTANLTLDDADPDYAALQQYDVVTVSNCSHAATFMITNDPTGSSGVLQHATGVVAPSASPNPGQSNSTTDFETIFGRENDALASVFITRGRTYSIGNSAAGACSAATRGYCALLEDGVELLEGVEDFQVLYGVDNDADTQVDAYQAAGAVANWNNVVSVRISLTFNDVESVQAAGTGIRNNFRTYTNTIRLKSRGA